MIKIKNDKQGDLQLFSVKVKDLEEGAYDVFLVDPEDEVDPGTKIGSIDIAAGEESGKLKFNTKRGDEVDPAPVGMRVEARNGDGDVLLSGLVPDPDAPKVKGNVKAKLDAADIAGTKGFVRLKLGNGAQFLQVVAQKCDAGTYEVMIDFGDETTADWQKAGELVIADGETSGSVMLKDKAGDSLPAGAATWADLMDRPIKVQTIVTEPDLPSVLLEGTIPSVGGKKGNGPK